MLTARTAAGALPETSLLIRQLLHDPLRFCALGGGITLRAYQTAPFLAILSSVRQNRGDSFVVMFPRQSGKNELQAQLETYLLLTYSLREAEIVKVSPTWKPQSLNAMRRLERVLERNCFTRGRWKKEQAFLYRLGRARVLFLSGQPEANIVGATASTLLEVDEAQDVSMEKFDKEIAPMAASTNATRVFWGTAWSSTTLLARELRAAQAQEVRDGCQRVFRVDAHTVGAEVPAYARFVAAQVARLGREHPLVKTQFFAEELQGEGGMFPPRRMALMQGAHPAEENPIPGALYAFLIDFAGGDLQESESSAMQDGAAANAARDYTALTIVRVDVAALADPLLRLPRYLCVHRMQWQGTPYPALYGALRTQIERWQPRFVVTDATGLGAPLSSFLQRAFPARVIPFVFSSASKSQLGWDFIALIEGGRWQDYAATDLQQEAYRAEFFRQLRATEMELRGGSGAETRALRWGVPEGARDTASSNEALHDDWVLSAALAARLDGVSWGSAAPDPETMFSPARDPLAELDAGF